METPTEVFDSIKNNLSNAYTSLENKRAVIPENKNIQNLASAVDSIEPLLEDINVNPTTNTQIFTATGDNDGLGKVTINPVTSSIDSNIIPTNIRKGKTILGVVGNLEVDKPDQIKTVNPKTTIQEVVADTGYELAKVTVNPVTSSVDSNIQAFNIKQGVSILGVTGTFEGGIKPTGTIEISENGSYDVSNYATANVNVQVGNTNIANDLISGTITEVTSDTLAGVESIRSNAFNGMDIETVSIPNNVGSVGDSAFANNSISTLTIDEGVQTIGNNAFQNNNIEEVTIPSTVTSIGSNAFTGNNLIEITMESDTPPIVTDTTFPSTLQITNVSYNGYENYVTDENWQTYKDTLVRGLAIPSTITVTVNNYLGELVGGAGVTIEGNGQIFTGTTDESGVFTQGDLQPATYTISVADLDGFKTPDAQEVVVDEDTENNVTVTYLEQAGTVSFADATAIEVQTIANEIATKGYTSAEVESTYGWKIGDTKDITLTTNEVIQVRIIGVNHDDLSDGSGKAGITLQMVNCLNTLYPMKSGGTNLGGYPSSDIRTTNLPAVKATLPQEWQDVIKMVDKKSANGGGTNYTETLTTSEDLFLLSYIEATGYTNDVQDASNEGSQYEYWQGKVKADRIKQYDSNRDGVVDTAVIWWLRSCRSTNVNVMNYIGADGSLSFGLTQDANGISFAFCVGSPKKFGDYTPAEISAISAEISTNNMTSEQVAETYGWNIGDTISYDLTTGETVEMRIIGFNHDDKSDGSGKAGITLEMTHCLATKYPMNSSSINEGGYAESVLRTTTLPTIKATLPQELQDVVVMVDKKSANGGGDNYSTIVTTSDDLFLLSQVEMDGAGSNSQDGANEGIVYEYWNGRTTTDRIKYYDTNADGVVDTAESYYLRSCTNNKTQPFTTVGNTGYFGNGWASASNCISYAFCI